MKTDQVVKQEATMHNQPTLRIVEQLDSIHKHDEDVYKETSKAIDVQFSLKSTIETIINQLDSDKTLAGLGYAASNLVDQVSTHLDRIADLSCESSGIAYEARDEQKKPSGPVALWEGGGLIDKCSGLSEDAIFDLIERAEKMEKYQRDDSDLPFRVWETVNSLATRIALKAKENAFQECLKLARERIGHHDEREVIEWLETSCGGAHPVLFTRKQVTNMHVYVEMLTRHLTKFEADLAECDLNFCERKEAAV